MSGARESLFQDLRTAGFPHYELSYYDARVALDTAIGILEDADLLDDFAQRAEEAIIEARAQSLEP